MRAAFLTKLGDVPNTWRKCSHDPLAAAAAPAAESCASGEVEHKSLETAGAVLEALGLNVLHLAGEALPGLPLVRAGGFAIVTKSGGFGAPDALVVLAAQGAAEKV